MSCRKEIQRSKKNVIPRRFNAFPHEVEFTSQDYFSLLPNEIIIKIFNFLSFWELILNSMVCKRWYSLSLNPKLWENVELQSREVKISSLEKILNQDVKLLQLKESTIIEDVFDRPLFKTRKFDNLQHLSIINTEVNLELLEELLGKTCNMKILTLESACKEYTFNTFKCISKLKLEELNLSWCTCNLRPLNTATNKRRKYKNFNALRRLKLHCFVDYEDLIRICPNLELLDLYCFIMNDAVFSEILQMKNLKKLSIGFSSGEIASEEVLSALQKCDNMDALSCLSMSNFNFYNHFVTLNEFLLRCNFLSELEFTHMDINFEIYEKILTMKHLRKLYLWGINSIQSDTSVVNILNNYEAIASLEYLGISFNNLQTYSYELEILIDLSINLKFLHLKNVYLSNVMYFHISTFSELETLFIHVNQSRVPAEAISAILKGCPKLIKHNLPVMS